ncbi:MAG: LD-carboxypeptidase [Bacteroidales bacterium]|jgi:muramoyltetrapeptide carboxypeptidase LdcA involved in peptidoglycan recycling|nr:LD-carboxypeptidase [Bacteroidales bacterium]
MTEIKNIIKPKKITKGSHIRVIAPARSLGLLSEDFKKNTISKIEKFGFTLSFGKHVNEKDEFNSSSIESRIEDLHDAFSDNDVDAILTVIGGYNANQLLDYIDYDLIKKNPKIICGFSDITAIANAITAKTGMLTYLGPHFSSWGMKKGFEYSMENFINCCMKEDAYPLLPSSNWSDDFWYIDQENREFIKNDGYWIINQGHAMGRIIGGHVRCLNSLQGTQYWNSLNDSILILEEDAEINPALFDRQLQSLIHQADFKGVRGILIGRFQKETNMTEYLLRKIIKTKKELINIPIVANVDFGHTTPLATMPIGGSLEILSNDKDISIKIIEH